MDGKKEAIKSPEAKLYAVYGDVFWGVKRQKTK
jgi:hypothetical protein